MDKAELCKLRIEDYARERESLRALEWKTYFQLYVGYAAILTAYTYLIDHARNRTTAIVVGICAAVVTTIVWIVEVILLIGIHDRMRASADYKRAYFEMLHSIIPLEIVAERDTKFGRKWATVPQWILALITTIAIIVYEIWFSLRASTFTQSDGWPTLFH
ncbi:MAG: hypothetical protein ABSG52_10540 [Terriglobales bacterium]